MIYHKLIPSVVIVHIILLTALVTVASADSSQNQNLSSLICNLTNHLYLIGKH